MGTHTKRRDYNIKMPGCNDDCSTISATTVSQQCYDQFNACPMPYQPNNNNCEGEGFRDRVRDFFHRSRSCSPCGPKQPQMKTCYRKEYYTVQVPCTKTVKVPCFKTKMQTKTIDTMKTVTKCRKVPYTVCVQEPVCQPMPMPCAMPYEMPCEQPCE